MNNTTNIIFISFLGLSLSSCAALERMEKERIEKEKQELAQMRSYNPSLVNFFEKEMKPLLKDKGQLAKSPRFDPNDPKLNLEKRFMEVSWGNRVSLLLNLNFR